MGDVSKNFQYFKKKLFKLREELSNLNKSNELDTKTVELDQSRIGRLSRMDAMQSQAMAVEAKRRRDIQLQRIEAALKRIDSDNYGFCVNCEDEIDAKRLEFDPTTFLCIGCAQNRD